MGERVLDLEQEWRGWLYWSSGRVSGIRNKSM